MRRVKKMDANVGAVAIVAVPTVHVVVYIVRCVVGCRSPYLRFLFPFFFSSTTACAAPRREIGTRKGEALT